jgi:SecD/SecF fusion protein
MVLTMGMAVDANVLIYERIREELAKGKDLLRSVRAGFDRAMVTILDTHVTTFLSGLVLYGVGVGPVRGFAVTLMWGLVTTVFTQFFVARLMFHYLLEWKVLKQYRTTNWLTGVRIDFVRLMVINLVVSSVVIVGGLLYAATVPAEKMLGLDFTGGANLQMVLEHPTTAQEVRSVIEGDAEFKRLFASPTVNTVGDPDLQGLHDTFNVRLKLTDQMRAQIEADREHWQQQRATAQQDGQPMPPDYVPPYLEELKRLFAGKLVQPAASGARVTPKAGNESWAFAEISLHFQEPVNLVALRDQLKKAGLQNPIVTDDKGTNATESREDFVQWTALSTTRDTQLLGIVREALGDLKTVSGKKLVLSNPFPEAEEIGGRMVGELRSAAIGALILSWALIILYLRVRYHEYRYGIAAVLALIHDLLVTFGVVVLFNSLGIVHAEIDLNMIACFLTIVGYSVNDTIVVFDRIRENAAEEHRLGERETYAALINRSLNQTLSRTVLSSGVTLCAVLAQLLVNWGSGSALESFAFGFSVGIISGTYSSIYIAAPLLLWWHKHDEAHRPPGTEGTVGRPEPAPVTTAG